MPRFYVYLYIVRIELMCLSYQLSSAGLKAGFVS